MTDAIVGVFGKFKKFAIIASRLILLVAHVSPRFLNYEQSLFYIFALRFLLSVGYSFNVIYSANMFEASSAAL